MKIKLTIRDIEFDVQAMDGGGVLMRRTLTERELAVGNWISDKAIKYCTCIASVKVEVVKEAGDDEEELDDARGNIPATSEIEFANCRDRSSLMTASQDEIYGKFIGVLKDYPLPWKFEESV